MSSARIEVVALDLPSGADVALRSKLPSRVVRRLAMRRSDRAECQSESGCGSERGGRWLDQLSARDRIAHVGQERRAIVIGGDDRSRLRECGLIAGIEGVVVAEEAESGAQDGLVAEEVRGC